MFRDTGGHTFQNIALMDFGQGLHGIVLFLRLEGSLEQLFDGFPSVLNDGLPLGFELVALAGERDLRFCVGIVGGTTLSDGQVVYRPAESLLRSEIAAIIWRIQQAKEG